MKQEYKYLSFIIVTLFQFSYIFLQNTNTPLEWTDPVSGTYYNFSSLKRDSSNPWKIKDGADNGLFSMVYYFNFGQNHNIKCKNQLVSVSEVLEVLKQPTDTCEVLGRFENREMSLIDLNSPSKGIIITYGGGDRCTNGDNIMDNGKARKSRFIIECSSSQDQNFKLNLPGGTQGTTKCTLEFKIRSPSGCPGGSVESKSSTILFYIILSLAIYIIIGLLVNKKTKNLSGKEALPHIEFWRKLPVLIQEGMSKTLSEFKFIAFNIKSKIKGINSKYSEI